MIAKYCRARCNFIFLFVALIAVLTLSLQVSPSKAVPFKRSAFFQRKVDQLHPFPEHNDLLKLSYYERDERITRDFNEVNQKLNDEIEKIKEIKKKNLDYLNQESKDKKTELENEIKKNKTRYEQEKSKLTCKNLIETGCHGTTRSEASLSEEEKQALSQKGIQGSEHFNFLKSKQESLKWLIFPADKLDEYFEREDGRSIVLKNDPDLQTIFPIEINVFDPKSQGFRTIHLRESELKQYNEHQATLINFLEPIIQADQLFTPTKDFQEKVASLEQPDQRFKSIQDVDEWLQNEQNKLEQPNPNKRGDESSERDTVKITNFGDNVNQLQEYHAKQIWLVQRKNLIESGFHGYLEHQQPTPEDLIVLNEPGIKSWEHLQKLYSQPMKSFFTFTEEEIEKYKNQNEGSQTVLIIDPKTPGNSIRIKISKPVLGEKEAEQKQIIKELNNQNTESKEETQPDTDTVTLSLADQDGNLIDPKILGNNTNRKLKKTFPFLPSKKVMRNVFYASVGIGSLAALTELLGTFISSTQSSGYPDLDERMADPRNWGKYLIPQLDTDQPDPKFITGTSAVFSGTINPKDSGADYIEFQVCADNEDCFKPNAQITHVAATNSDGSPLTVEANNKKQFIATVQAAVTANGSSTLKPGTTYWLRSAAYKNNQLLKTSNAVPFTTLATSERSITSFVSAAHSLQLNVTQNSLDKEFGRCYLSFTETSNSAENKEQDVDCGQSSVNVTGLSPNTEYQISYHSIPKLSDGQFEYGSESVSTINIKTKQNPEILKDTLNASANDLTANIQGSLKLDGAPTTVWFAVGTDPSQLNQQVQATLTPADADGISIASAQLTQISPGTTYYYQLIIAEQINPQAITASRVHSFTPPLKIKDVPVNPDGQVIPPPTDKTNNNIVNTIVDYISNTPTVTVASSNATLTKKGIQFILNCSINCSGTVAMQTIKSFRVKHGRKTQRIHFKFQNHFAGHGGQNIILMPIKNRGAQRLIAKTNKLGLKVTVTTNDPAAGKQVINRTVVVTKKK